MRIMVAPVFPSLIAMTQREVDSATKQNELNDSMSLEIMGNQMNDTSIEDNVLGDPRFASIRSFVQESIDTYVRDILKSPNKLGIASSWCNYAQRGDRHHQHNHMNAYLSGVYYLTSGSTIRFLRPQLSSLMLDQTEQNPMNADVFDFEPQQGSLILFPSYLMHQVAPHELDEPRVSLAFNAFPAESFGWKTGFVDMKMEGY